jgi:hypothetical protein
VLSSQLTENGIKGNPIKEIILNILKAMLGVKLKIEVPT